ncbi:D-erythronate dehydrogenase [Lentilitoribacter sp. EG35]|uniref:D-erythronate dehydrogenase n=1 Tax=Lentilitoribacter sp. EG35 TaxID=3234192 RepID=UPI00345F5B29
MKIAILGGSGFIGQKLTKALVEKGELRGEKIKQIALCDMVSPQTDFKAEFPITYKKFDITDIQSVGDVIEDDVDVIYHLASIVSGQAEADLELGYEVNLDGMRNLLARCVMLEKPPIVVFSSSIAVYSADTPQPIRDHFIRAPRSSYGTQKVICELLLNDYSRRGLIDGRGIRLPTITVRPGKPNAAASSFLSSIVREPLNGEKAICPVGEGYSHWFSSPRIIIRNIIHAAEIDGADLGNDRCIMLPGINASVKDILAALRNVAGQEVVELIQIEHDQKIKDIVETWVAELKPNRAYMLGFFEDTDFESIIKAYIEDEMS